MPSIALIAVLLPTCRLKYRRETRFAGEAVTVSFRIKYTGMEWSLKIKLIARSIVVVCVCAG